jgi:hypothetical protein
MCWNASVSLNTFLFSIFVLLLIIYNNAFTKYKIHELNSIWIYLFFASFIFMQLIEFFIWRNINHPFYNHIFSVIGSILIMSQPIFSIMILSKSNIRLRNLFLLIYTSVAIPYFIYKVSTQRVYSTISKGGHLNWKFVEMTSILTFGWFFFLLFSLIYEKKWVGFWFGLLSLCLIYYNYKNDNSAGSMWCWAVNLIMIYYAIYLLMYLPFYEKGKIC